MKTSLFLEGQGMADSFEEKTRNQTLQLPRFWTPSYYESSVGENSEYVKSRRLDYVFHLWSV
jgi:REP element-mobilizing transposase RayT